MRVGWDVQLAGWRAGCRRRRPAGSGMARNRARARLNWVSQGQRWGQMQGGRRAERVSRPAIEKNRRRRVLSVASCSPRPMRAVQRSRLCAITWIASQAAFLGHPGESPRGWIHIMTPVRSKSGINMQRNSGCGDHGAVLRLRVAAFKIPAARFSKKRLLDDGDSRRTSASSDVRMNCSGS